MPRSRRPAPEVPLPLAQVVLTGTNRPDLMVNVPHSGACSAENERLGTERMDRRTCQWLLRKEVIQPHLPVRLPCYDLVLIASPTFDGSLHKG